MQVKALTQTVSAQQAQLKDAQAKPPAAPMSDLESRQRAAIIAEADKVCANEKNEKFASQPFSFILYAFFFPPIATTRSFSRTTTITMASSP